MACNMMLLLCGESYARRLWCIWELFTLLAFTDLDVALERLLLIPVAGNECDELTTFKLDTCYTTYNETTKQKHWTHNNQENEQPQTDPSSQWVADRLSLHTCEYLSNALVLTHLKRHGSKQPTNFR